MPLVEDLMTKQIITVEPGISVLEASRVMARNEVGCVIVMDEGRAVGIVTERDMLTKVISKGKAPSRLKVLQIMSSPVITVSPDDSVRKAAKLMKDRNIRRLVVVKGDKLRGIITIRDITGSILGTIAELTPSAES